MDATFWPLFHNRLPYSYSVYDHRLIWCNSTNFVCYWLEHQVTAAVLCCIEVIIFAGIGHPVSRCFTILGQLKGLLNLYSKFQLIFRLKGNEDSELCENIYLLIRTNLLCPVSSYASKSIRFFRLSYQNKIRCFARISDILWITHLPEDSLRVSGNLALTGILLYVPKRQQVTGRGWKTLWCYPSTVHIYASGATAYRGPWLPLSRGF